MSLFGRPLADGDRLDVAGAVVRLKVHTRARRVSLRLDRTKREVVATAPSVRRLSEAAAFATERAAWIAARLAELPQSQSIAPGVTISLFGQPCRLESAAHPVRYFPATEDQPARIAARGEGETYARAVVRLLKKHALSVFADRTAHYCAELGARVIAVTDDDGSSAIPALGERLRAEFRAAPPAVILVCGAGVLARLAAELGAEWGVPVQVSLEAHMACGLGYCHGCAAPVATDPETEGPLVCVDGPVFDAVLPAASR